LAVVLDGYENCSVTSSKDHNLQLLENHEAIFGPKTDEV